MKLVVFCEAPADFRIARDLVDRVLREVGPPWVPDVMEANPEGIRIYLEDDQGRSFFDIHHLTDYEDQLGVRVPHGHFDGRPGAAGALMARTIFWIVRKLMKDGAGVDAVIIVWDMDDQPGARRFGLEQARTEAESATFRIILGCPNLEREAWVLAGFDPEGPDEEGRMAGARRELGFAPNAHSHQLTATDEQAKRSAKRVLRVLTLENPAREERCWMETPLATLRDRGAENGLRDFLLEVEERLMPLCTQP
jgi:hypothetical protein